MWQRLKQALGWPELADAPDVVIAPPRPVRDEKAEFHIRRFTLALEQCAKGPERQAELERNLNYWLRVKAANAALRGEA